MDARTAGIEAIGLTRRFGEVTVLDVESLEVGQGVAVALLGPTVRARPRWSTSCPP